MQNNNIVFYKKQRIFPFILVLSVFFIKFVPFPMITFLGFAPENFIFLLLAIYLFLNSSIIFESKSILFIISLFSVFYLLELFFDILQNEPSISIAPQVRSILLIFSVAFFCSNKERFILSLKFFVSLIVFSVVFGAFVYFIGEPFISIREWFTRSASTYESAFIGRGSQLTGLYGLPHIFGYVMAGAPILCFTLFLAVRRFVWLVFLLISSVGLLLNAERSALLMNVIVFSIILWRQRNRFLLFIALSLCVIIIAIFQHIFIPASIDTEDTYNTNISGQYRTSYRAGSLNDRLNTTTTGEVFDRIKWQLYGIKAVFKHPLIGVTQSQYAHEVYSDSLSAPNQKQIERTLSPHNHYVNVGLKAGIWGWIILSALLWRIVIMLKTNTSIFVSDQPLVVLALGVKLSVVATMGNALFHNAGLFSGELASITTLAFLMALHHMSQSPKAKI